MLETVYEHIKGNDTFTVTAAERWSVGMIRRLKEKYPDEVDIRYLNQDGSILAHLPIEWMRIVPKRNVSASIAENLYRSSRRGENEAIFKDNIPEVSEDSPEYRRQERGEYISCE